MNHLNSVLFEGAVVEDPVFVKNDNEEALLTLRVASTRYHKTKEGFSKQISVLIVKAHGRLAESANTAITKDCGIRVVGRLYQEYEEDGEGYDQSYVEIVAEHIELAPRCAHKNEDASEEEVF